MSTLYQFAPKPDITVAELAEILASVLNVQSAAFQETMLAPLSESGKRHFVEKLSNEKAFFALLGGGRVAS